MVDWGEVTRHGGAVAAFHWWTGFGRISVIVFFVLSGYLVGGRALAAIHNGTFDPAGYTLNRLSRLYPPLLAAIVLTAILDGIGLHFSNTLGYYDYPSTYRLTGQFAPVADTLNARTALSNLLFLQTLAAPTFGSDGPLWSLANEFWYYILGPLAFLCLLGSSPGRLRVLAVFAALVAAAFWLNGTLLALSVTWLAGAIAYRHARRLPSPAAIGLMILFAGVAAAERSIRWFPEHQLTADLTLAVFFALALWSLGRPGSAPVRGTLSARLAGFSYSLYLVHVPLLFLVSASALQWLSTPVRLQPGALSLSLYAVGLGCAIALAWLVSRVTEARTPRVRDWIARQIPASAFGRGAGRQRVGG